jgi:serine O-acetyltransferase
MASTDATLGFKELMFSDYRRYRNDRPSFLKIALNIPFHPGLLASLFLRTQWSLYKRGHNTVAWSLRALCCFLTGADLIPGADVGPGVMLSHPEGLSIGLGAKIGSNVTFAGGVVLGVRDPESGDVEAPTIGDGVFLGAHCVLVGTVTIGENAFVGANTVVVNDVPANAIVMGVPAKNIGTRESPEARKAAREAQRAERGAAANGEASGL